jgi:hypothetical protein
MLRDMIRGTFHTMKNGVIIMYEIWFYSSYKLSEATFRQMTYTYINGYILVRSDVCYSENLGTGKSQYQWKM